MTPGQSAAVFSYAYAANSSLVKSVTRGAHKRSYEYEPDSHRLETLQHLQSDTVTSEIRVAYDALGRKELEKHWGEVPTALGRAPGFATDYLYNSSSTLIDPQPTIDRNELIMSGKHLMDNTSATAGWSVTSTLVSGTSRGYVHDAIGNRTQADEAYVPNALNQYASVGGTAFSYDQNGNLTSDGARSYVYDAENRLVKVVKSGNTYDYVYDYLGRRASKKKNGAAEVRFIYDGWNLVAETDASGSILRKYTWGLDASGSLQGAGGVGGLLLIEEGAQSYYPIYDSGANVVGLRDETGATAAAYDYDAFGSETARAGAYAATNPFRFSTKYTDEETGLVYYGMRFYSPELGRFLNRDPIGEAGGLNLYGFVGNDPANGYDYLGMKGWWDYLFGSKGNDNSNGAGATGEIHVTDENEDGYADTVTFYDPNTGETRRLTGDEIPDFVQAGMNRYNMGVFGDRVNMYMMDRAAEIDSRRELLPGKPASLWHQDWRNLDRATSGAVFLDPDYGAAASLHFLSPSDALMTRNLASIGADVGLSVVFEPFDWLATGAAIGRDPGNGWSYASAIGLLPLIPGSVGRMAAKNVPGPGQFARVQDVTGRAARYQSQITGRMPDVGYIANGTKFDGFANGTLLDAKGFGYAKFVKDGQFRSWFRGADDLVSQAQRQLNAANGTPIQWHFAEEAAANATRSLFQSRGISGIDVIFTAAP